MFSGERGCCPGERVAEEEAAAEAAEADECGDGGSGGENSEGCDL